MTETIDLTPTWSGVLPLLLLAYTEGNATGRKEALIELQRMAAICDRANVNAKAAKALLEETK